MINDFVDGNAIHQFKCIIKDQLKDISRYKVYDRYNVQYKKRAIYKNILIDLFYH